MNTTYEKTNYHLEYNNDMYEKIFVNNLPNDVDPANATNTTASSAYALNQTAIDLLQQILINSQSSIANLFNDSEHNEFENDEHSENVTTSSILPNLNTLSLRKTCLVVFFSSVILITVFGNTLVILSVITTRRLRTVTNCFVMSLAIADWMVGIFVMPPAVMLYIYGKNLYLKNKQFMRCTPGLIEIPKP